MINRHDNYFPSAALVVLVALCLLLLPWLGLTLFYSKGEPREAVVAMSMLQSGDWILPVSYGGDMPYKPPFVAWIIAALAKLLNGGTVNEYISRLPSAIAAIAMIMGGFSWARRIRGDRFAVIFSFVTIGSFEVFRASVACRLDMVLTACMVGAIYIMYEIREGKRRHKWPLYLAVILLLTCATLTKGPVGALLPCMVIGVYKLFRHDNFFATFFGMLGLAAVALGLSAWWYYLAWVEGGDNFYNLMYEENIGRLLGQMSYGSHVKPLWYNFATLALGLLPWTVLLLALCFGRRRGPLLPHMQTAGLLCVVAAVVIIGFYCIPESKRSVYLLPAYPFICYGITSAIEAKATSKAMRFFAWFIALIAIAAPMIIIAAQIWAVPGLRLAPVPWWGYILLLLPLAAGIAWIANRHSPVGHIVVAVWAIYMAYLSAGMPAVLNPRSDFRAIERLQALQAPEIVSINTDWAHRFYSLNFYLGDRLRALDTPADAIALPTGSAVLYPLHSDTTGLTPYFRFEPLLDRSADHRDAIGLAIRQ